MKHWFRIYRIWNCATASLSQSGEADFPQTDRRRRLNALYDLPIRTDMEPDMDIAFALAERHGLSFYDAIYLELAKRHTAPLATLDKALARASAYEGLHLVCGHDAT